MSSVALKPRIECKALLEEAVRRVGNPGLVVVYDRGLDAYGIESKGIGVYWDPKANPPSSVEDVLPHLSCFAD